MEKLKLYIEKETLEKIKDILGLDEHDVNESDDALDLVETLISNVIEAN